MPQARQLSVIMFTEIVGYTALMGNDEKKAYSLLDKNRMLQRPLFEDYHGVKPNRYRLFFGGTVASIILQELNFDNL